MILTIELTDTEYLATQNALRNAKGDALMASNGYASPMTPDMLQVMAMELDHLRTLLAEAAAPDGRCNGCDQTAERCTDWGGECCPLCKHKVATPDQKTTT